MALQFDSSVITPSAEVGPISLPAWIVITLEDFQRGIHDINNEIVFSSNPGFVFHDSCGFEAGSEGELKAVLDFIEERAQARSLDQKLHAIWYVRVMRGRL
jgi:hypothetical protein